MPWASHGNSFQTLQITRVPNEYSYRNFQPDTHRSTSGARRSFERELLGTANPVPAEDFKRSLYIDIRQANTGERRQSRLNETLPNSVDTAFKPLSTGQSSQGSVTQSNRLPSISNQKGLDVLKLIREKQHQLEQCHVTINKLK